MQTGRVGIGLIACIAVFWICFVMLRGFRGTGACEPATPSAAALLLPYQRASTQPALTASDAAALSTNPDAEFDIVYTWVNGSDPRVSAARAKHVGIYASNDRDRDNGELRLSLRSLEKYMPWWQKGMLYIVTSGEVPCWLNTKHPRVRVVTHKDIFADPDALPTFSSYAIEPNFHRIPGIRKHFVLMNDDFFVSAPVLPSDFFRDGRPVLRFEPTRIRGGLTRQAKLREERKKLWVATICKSRGMLEQYFGLTEDVDPPNPDVFKFMKHAPTSIDRDRLAQLWQLFPKEFRQVTHDKVRTFDGFHMAFVHHHFCLLEGKDQCVALPQEVQDHEATFTTVGSDPSRVVHIMHRLLLNSPKFFNLNDEQDGHAKAKVMADYVYRVLMPRLYPTPSQWEAETCPIVVLPEPTTSTAFTPIIK